MLPVCSRHLLELQVFIPFLKAAVTRKQPARAPPMVSGDVVHPLLREAETGLPKQGPSHPFLRLRMEELLAQVSHKRLGAILKR